MFSSWETEWWANSGKRAGIFNTYDDPGLLKGADMVPMATNRRQLALHAPIRLTEPMPINMKQ